MDEKEKTLQEIEKLLDTIKLEESFNKNSGSLSFLYYQLWMLQAKLEKL